MRTETLLVADNLSYFLEAEVEFLQNAGYHVIPAVDPVQAATVLREGGVDLAILDVRLRDDDDPEDVSGLEVARDVAPQIPKIIFTNYPTWELVKESLSPSLSGLPPAVDFVSKDEGPMAILGAVEWALHRTYLKDNILLAFGADNFMDLKDRVSGLGPEDAAHRLNQSFEATAAELVKYREEESNRAAQYHNWALAMAVCGMVVIILGAVLSLFLVTPTSVLSAVAAVLFQGASLLLFKREDAALKQVRDTYHRLEETNKLKDLLTLCDTIPLAGKREEYRLKLIDVIVQKWFGTLTPSEMN